MILGPTKERTMLSANEIAAKLLNSNFLAQALPGAQAATALSSTSHYDRALPVTDS